MMVLVFLGYLLGALLLSSLCIGVIYLIVVAIVAIKEEISGLWR